jgi:hypothetical protein
VELVGKLAVPPVATARDLAAAMSLVVAAATQDAITPDEAVAPARMAESFTLTLHAAHVERKRHRRGRLWWQLLTKRQRGDHDPSGSKLARVL